MQNVKQSVARRLKLSTYSFEELQFRYERREQATLRGRVFFMLLDPPYNMRLASKKSNSDHDTLSEDDMDHVVN